MDNAASVRDLIERRQELERKINGLGAADENKRREEILELLHRYNDVKDAAQAIIGALANINSVTIRSLHVKFDLPLDS